MNRDDLREFLKNNWYLVVAMVALVIVAGGLWLRPVKETPARPEGVGSLSPGDVLRPDAPELHIATPPKTTEERAQETIDEHLATIEAKPDDPDTPARLLAIATLFKTQKRDYKQAAAYYERIIREYPTWETIGTVFPDLEVCLKQFGETNDLKWLYTEWMRLMPSDSQEYLYAEKALSELP